MNKEIKINFSHIKHEFLVRFFENGLLITWKSFTDTKEVRQAIADFYFPTANNK